MRSARAVDGRLAPATAGALVITPGEVEAVRKRVVGDVVQVEVVHAHCSSRTCGPGSRPLCAAH